MNKTMEPFTTPMARQIWGNCTRKAGWRRVLDDADVDALTLFQHLDAYYVLEMGWLEACKAEYITRWQERVEAAHTDKFVTLVRGQACLFTTWAAADVAGLEETARVVGPINSSFVTRVGDELVLSSDALDICCHTREGRGGDGDAGYAEQLAVIHRSS